ncbi:hypothetical protein Asp14428_42840 [Actinoplanes sp. NBRC 14428]|nr:hypothetical protein Asp14428_42840 [Actinoplanes sp. NBRC 14428]
MDVQQLQLLLCERVGCTPDYVAGQAMVGASASLFGPVWPIKGIRHLPVGGTSGWYVWVGEYSDASDFFKPQHAQHILDSRPQVAGYLGLPPGWGFIIAPDYEDVWYDEELLVR